MATLADCRHPICPADEVNARTKAFTLLGQRLAAFRAAAGLAVFDDLCIHRGTARSLGTVEEGLLTRPYRGWRYDSTGAWGEQAHPWSHRRNRAPHAVRRTHRGGSRRWAS